MTCEMAMSVHHSYGNMFFFLKPQTKCTSSSSETVWFVKWMHQCAGTCWIRKQTYTHTYKNTHKVYKHTHTLYAYAHTHIWHWCRCDGAVRGSNYLDGCKKRSVGTSWATSSRLSVALLRATFSSLNIAGLLQSKAKLRSVSPSLAIR